MNLSKTLADLEKAKGEMDRAIEVLTSIVSMQDMVSTLAGGVPKRPSAALNGSHPKRAYTRRRQSSTVNAPLRVLILQGLAENEGSLTNKAILERAIAGGATGPDALVRSRISVAMNTLKHAGLVKNVMKGVWALTAAGSKAAAKLERADA